jgi:hypothetical protein
VEKKKINSAQLVMQGGELSLMEIQLKSTSVYFVIDEVQ